jgi:molybdopterin-guanine dinucleotide biosynthesis protein A
MKTNERKRVGPSVGLAGYVMAGGASRRFGSDKAVAEIDGQKMLRRMYELLDSVVGSARIVAPKGRYPEYADAIVEDRWPGEGPLGGIITAVSMTAAEAPDTNWNLIVSCDMPFLSKEWLGYLRDRALASEAEVLVPRSENGLEPLCACWRTAAVHSLRATFAHGTRKVTEAMKCLRIESLDEKHWKRFDSAGRLFWNINTPQDYQELLRTWRTGHQ